jgi:4'-phosphopantetheinyl transferase
MRIHANEVHIWSASLLITSEQESADLELLSADEIKRAQQFHFRMHKRRFIAARALLRKLLAYYLSVAPQEIQFAYTEYKKPYVIHATPLQFNLSHSHELALYAFTLHHSVGIDIEKIRAQYTESVAKRFFSPEENKNLLQLAGQERTQGFYRIWARKEALIKALGKGFSLPTAIFSVSAQAIHEKIKLEGQIWSLLSLLTEDGFEAALATNQRLHLISYWQFVGQKPKLINTSTL